MTYAVKRRRCGRSDLAACRTTERRWLTTRRVPGQYPEFVVDVLAAPNAAGIMQADKRRSLLPARGETECMGRNCIEDPSHEVSGRAWPVLSVTEGAGRRRPGRCRNGPQPLSHLRGMRDCCPLVTSVPRSITVGHEVCRRSAGSLPAVSPSVYSPGRACRLCHTCPISRLLPRSGQGVEHGRGRGA
jgi:hypothetical protein